MPTSLLTNFSAAVARALSQRRTRRLLVLVTLALPALLSTAACGSSSSSAPPTNEWDDEVTGVIAQVNDVLALDLLPALVGLPPGAVQQNVDPATAKPDLARVKTACEKLTSSATGFSTLAGNAPDSRSDTARKLKELDTLLARVATECIRLAVAGDPGALTSNQPISDGLRYAGDLEKNIASDLHSGSKCPERIRASVKSCSLPGS